MSKVFFQTVQGIWSPRDGAFTYVVCEEFDNYKDAKRWAKAETEKSDDPTLVILEVRSKVLWRSALKVEAEAG